MGRPTWRDARFGNMGKGAILAGLNFGDWFSYALSEELEEPLLFKGNDFAQIDVDCYPANNMGKE